MKPEESWRPRSEGGGEVALRSHVLPRTKWVSPARCHLLFGHHRVGYRAGIFDREGRAFDFVQPSALKLPDFNYSKLAGFLIISFLVLFLSACVGLSQQQQSDNSVTRHEQRAEGVQDPMKER